MHNTSNRIPSILKKFNITPHHFSGDGMEAIVDCPNCNEDKHLYINRANGLWMCHHCGASGKLISYLELLLPEFQESFAGTAAIALSKNRGLKIETLRDEGIGYNELTKEYLYPVYDKNGRLQNIYTCKIRNGKLTKLFGLTGFSSQLFGLNKLNSSKELYICEGPWDMLVLRELGLCAVAVPGANTFKKEWVKYFPDKSVYIVYDNDKAGRNGTEKVARLLHNVADEIKYIKWSSEDPVGFDVRDLRIMYGIEALNIIQSRLYDVKKEHFNINPSNESIHGMLWGIFHDKNLSYERKLHECAQTVRNVLQKIGTFHHTDDTDFSSCLFFDSNQKILYFLQSDEFYSFLSDFLNINRASKLFTYIQKAIENEALSKRSQKTTLRLYWAFKNGKVYLSCGQNKMARISANKVEMVDSGEDGILFHPKFCLTEWSFNDPIDPFETFNLFKNISTDFPHTKLLLKLWFISLPTNPRNKPVLVISGPVGSGKTSLIRNVFNLLGMPQRISCPKERDGEESFWILLNGGGIVVIDNVDVYIRWLPDNVAAASTGGTFEKRKLYSNNERMSYAALAWLVLTSANPMFLSDAGLSDRIIAIILQRIANDTSDLSLTLEIEENRDGAMTWLCNVLSKALADNTPVPQGLNKRHPDFAEFAVHIGRALGNEKDAIKALRAAENDKSIMCIHNDTLGSLLLDIIPKEGFEGTASELLEFIRKETGIESKYYQLTPKQVGVRINKIWAHLEKVTGATKEKNRTGTTIYKFPTSRKDQKTSCKIPKPKRSI